MTIDEAIKYANLLALDMLRMENMCGKDTQAFGRMCADALRLAKQKEEENYPCVPETWQERMKREYRETKERYEKLNWLLVKHAAGTLDFTLKCPIELLKAQREHMSNYLYTLEIRAEIEGVNLYD